MCVFYDDFRSVAVNEFFFVQNKTYADVVKTVLKSLFSGKAIMMASSEITLMKVYTETHCGKASCHYVKIHLTI